MSMSTSFLLAKLRFGDDHVTSHHRLKVFQYWGDPLVLSRCACFHTALRQTILPCVVDCEEQCSDVIARGS